MPEPQISPRKPSQGMKRNQPLPQKGGWLWIVLVMTLIGMLYYSSLSYKSNPMRLSYSEFYTLLEKGSIGGRGIRTAIKVEDQIHGELTDGAPYTVHIPPNDPDVIKLLRSKIDMFDVRPPRTLMINLFYSLGPMLLFIGFLWFFVYRGSQGGGRILSFGKSRAKQRGEGHMKVTFKDVAGVDEAQSELREVIDFLIDPKKFQRLGGKIPKGVLLMGPPGTGKTLLAKAVSGEAGVPFFSISGSDFVEMFVGVGASRVRDLFEQAKKSSKTSGKGCIIFIDEVDAVGRQRFAGIGGGHDEREQTLNALLVEMDGFDTQEAVILIAATNRPDVLDPALLRPGRFDRQIVIDRPDIIGREAIMKVHSRTVKLAPEVDLRSIARQTPGFSGADLANLVNEAALLAAREDCQAVGMPEMESAIERVMAGPERKSRVISDYEKKITAYHEAGHALLSFLTPGVDPLHKVSIIARGTSALGYTMQLPLEDRYLMTRTELNGKLIGLLGGRASEDLIFSEITTGAGSDLERASEIARMMVCRFGMSERLGNLTFGRKEGQVFLGRDLGEDRNYSDRTAQLIDEEIRRIIDESYTAAKHMLTEHKTQLIDLAELLLEKEVIDGAEVKRFLGFTTDTEPPQVADEEPPVA